MIFKTTKPKLKHYNIPPTDENHELLRKAKAAIAASHPEQALELLSTLKLKPLDIEITALSARLADLERTQRFGTESFDTETREHNKINKSIIFLITALEKEIAQSFEFYDKIRAALKSRYETRLSQKLSNRQPVNLRLVPSTAGTTPQAANTFVQYSEGQIRGKLAEYYKDANGRLLLVGVPGAGKTTLLLQLELEFLEREITRIPVILNLARWSSEFPTLEAWIQEILPSEMGLVINKKVAGDLVTQNRLILLMDGLDEVKAEDRKTCLEAIGLYGEDPKRLFIISSRIDEYNAVAKDAPVNGQVEVGTLTYEQLIEQLEKVNQNEGSQRLLAALKEDELLRRITEVPFYFNILQLLFARGKFLNDFNFSALNITDRKQELEKKFVEEMLRSSTVRGYNPQQILYFLSFFATKLKQKNIIDFELTHLQYDWCNLSKSSFYTIGFIQGTIDGVKKGAKLGFFFGILCFSGGILAIFEHGFNGLFFLGIILLILPLLCLSSGAIGGLITGIFNIFKWPQENGFLFPIVTTKEYLRWELFGGMLKKFLTEILLGSFSVLIILMVIALFNKGMGDLFDNITFITLLIFSISITLGLEESLDVSYGSLIQISAPLQRFKASAKLLHFSIFQYYHISFLIKKQKKLTKNLIIFLDDMVKCNILETTGASWRFRHRILQDYFADQWVETEFEPEQK
ncbi:NACHT domain-containing protein [Haliscomenobacter sp.]|uniref:NACHT domain-containing protein n=1 Tax=Haliscomenobacter sp. TaxID=2717303 RepID=UPI003BACA192